MYTNETQSPWSLSHRQSSMTLVKTASGPKPGKPQVASIKPRTSRRQGGSEGAAGNPLYLQHLFAANVRIVRTAKGLSQEELAHRASIDRTYVSSVERRLRNVSLQNVQRLAQALDVDPRDLLNPSLSDDPTYSSNARRSAERKGR